MSSHRLLAPSGLPEAVGFAHGVVAAAGRLLFVAGQTGHQADGSLPEGLVAQFAAACRNVARVLEEAGGSADDLVSVTIYTSDIGAYRGNLAELGRSYRGVFGKHYPAMALLGVVELLDPEALVELACVAVLHEAAGGE